jgi:hypothetical protein
MGRGGEARGVYMNKLIAVVAAVLFTGCASAQLSVEQATERAKCVLSALKPVEAYFTEEQVNQLLEGELDVKETLLALDFKPAEVVKVAEDVKACFDK